MTLIPEGFRVAGHHCGLKRATQLEDIALLVCDHNCTAAGVYTQNQVVAAPVLLDRQRTPTANARAVIVNAGNANACTGQQGMSNARRMLDVTASAIGVDSEQVLIMSTGIIGEQLPMDLVEAGIAAAAQKLDRSDDALEAAARGILTTDTKTKVATRSLLGGARITGIAKGSGMIGPNMATMLSVILTDAAVTPEDAQRLLSRTVEESFNAINVDGHTSTNDTVLLLASGREEQLQGAELEAFADGLREVAVELAKKIVDDGEGATHLIEIKVTGAANHADAATIAKTIANSPLVKTAIAGHDPNWGRIVSAAGYAGPPIDVDAMRLVLNGTSIFEQGSPVNFDAKQVSQSMAQNRNIFIELSVGKGDGVARYWTCDLTHEYVTINAEYHT